LPHLAKTQGIALAAAADPREDARRAFSESTGLAAFKKIEELVKGAEIDAVWIATPNECHADHAVIAASAGKHVICEKPIA
jgi:phthalate 4,5-cis-dihydrodiol dehydrogenase